MKKNLFNNLGINSGTKNGILSSDNKSQSKTVIENNINRKVISDNFFIR